VQSWAGQKGSIAALTTAQIISLYTNNTHKILKITNDNLSVKTNTMSCEGTLLTQTNAQN